MAIPHWTWPDAANDAAGLADAADAFDALSDPTRARILDALHDADTPLAYTDLQEATGVRDNGRLNYHLRHLDDFLERASDGYTLSDRGRALVTDLLAADALTQPE